MGYNSHTSLTQILGESLILGLIKVLGLIKILMEVLPVPPSVTAHLIYNSVVLQLHQLMGAGSFF